MSQEPPAAPVAAQLLARIARRVGASLALDETLDAVAAAVVEALGFRAAVVNLLGPDDELHVVAVAGSDDIKASLQGTHSPRAAWNAMLAAAAPWGALRFLSHESGLPADAAEMRFFVPDLPIPGDGAAADLWHPLDALFAPLLSGDGALLGVLSVDDPVDGLLPSPERRALLETFAVQAALAIEHAREHKALRDSEEMLRRLFDESPVGKLLLGPDGTIERVNRAYCEFMGRPAEAFIGRTPVEFAHPSERETTAALSAALRAPDCPGGIERVEKRYMHAQGHELWGRLNLARIGDGDEVRVLAAIENITEARLAAEQLRHQALHDSLTGLPNRLLIFDRLSQALARARRDGSRTAVVVVDVDHFKLVNDSYGHPVGDQMLSRVAAALRGCLRDSDTAGRLGGDEFIVVCEDVDGPAEATAIVERLRAAARMPVQIGDVTLFPSASLGCTLAHDDADGDQLIAEADAALYRAKAAGRGGYEMFDEEMRRTSHDQLELRAELARALPNDELRLFYQPIVDLTTGTPIGYEALLRWQHPTRGLLLPAEFLANLVDSDLDVPVTQWVLRQACVDVAELGRSSGEQPFVSVNLSPRQLGRPELAADVEAALTAARLPGRQLWLEITEEHVVDERHRPMLDRLQSIGCVLALDDFGTGYSGLTYLQQLPVQVLKIDREFVARVDTDRVSAGITAAVTDLAAVIGIRVVAEGVETVEQAQLLRDMGVQAAQGYLFGRPQPLVNGWTAEPPTGGLPRQRVERGEPGQPDLSTVNDSMTTG